MTVGTETVGTVGAERTDDAAVEDDFRGEVG